MQFLVALVGVYRFDGPDIDPILAKSEAEVLHNAVKARANHEEITRIIGTRSKAQLVATFNRYKDEYGASIKKVEIEILFSFCTLLSSYSSLLRLSPFLSSL